MQALIIVTGLIVVLILHWYGEKAGIMPVPTLPSMRRAMLDLMPPSAKHVAELGSGWGGLAKALQHQGKQVTAFEISPLPRFVSRLRGVYAINSDFMTQDLSRFDAIVCYLSPKHMDALASKFAKELKTGTAVISNAFPITNWTPMRVVRLGAHPERVIYFYKKS